MSHTTTYTVTIKGQQQHIRGYVYENQTAAQVAAIIDQQHDTDYPMPQMDGNSYELNGDMYITIQPNKVDKSQYEVFSFNGGYYGICSGSHGDNCCVFGGNSADEDSYDRELIESVFAEWDGTLVDGHIFLG